MKPGDYYSRLQRRQERFTQRQIYLFLAGSVALLVVLVLFGIPFLFSLTAKISGLKKGSSDSLGSSDQVMPAAPSISQDFRATSSAQIKVTGATDPKVTVELFQSNVSQGTVVSDENGKFSFDVSLNKGDNTFYAQTVSDSGKRSAKSDYYVVSYLSTPPKLDLNGIKDGDSFGSSPINLSGSTDPGAIVTINGHQVIVASDGSFNTSLNLNAGDNKIKIESFDQAGNKTSKEITVKLNQ